MHSLCIVENRFRELFVFDDCPQQHHRCRHDELLKYLKCKHKRLAVAILQMLLIRAAILNWECSHPQGVPEGTSLGASFSSLTIDISDGNTKNITSNGARGAKMIFPSGREVGFKMNSESLD